MLTITIRRSPHGERGLKSLRVGLFWGGNRSLPSRGAWIEIFFAPPSCRI